MKGFSMVELMVAISIIALISGGAMVAAGRFGDSQKLTSARDQLVSTLRLARNYAKTVQVSDVGLFRYVEVTISGNGEVTAMTNYGQKLSSRDVTSPEIGLAQSPSETIKFSPYLGKLLVESGSNFVPAGNDYNIRAWVYKNSDTGETLSVVINGSGLIDGR